MRLLPGASRHGFTAIEIAMAMLLIGCFTFLILSWDVYARRRALDNVCLSNVKQLGVALQMYAADNHFRLPPKRNDWQAVYLYIKNTGILVCPLGPVHPPPAAGAPASDYLLNPVAQSDDLPETILAGDDAPDRHLGGRWNGARADGAAASFPADEWQTRLVNPGTAGLPSASAKEGERDGG